MTSLTKQHRNLKSIRGRGSLTQSHLALVRYLKSLEEELVQVGDALMQAWEFAESKHFIKCIRHADAAQQRLHQVIKKLAKRKKK